MNDWAIGGRWPDLVVLLDVDPSVMTTRLQRAPDRLEQAGDGFHERVRNGYLAMAAADPDPKRWIVIDGSRGEDEVANAVLAAVEPRL